jgi:hypothetical protein
MVLSEICIKRPVFATVLSLLVLLIGLVSFTRLAVREYPKIDEPMVTVTTRYRGASAEVVESQVTKPLEDSIAGIDAVDVITSISRAEQSQISVRFRLEKDADAAAAEVRDRTSRVRNKLPQSIEEPVIAKVEADAFPVQPRVERIVGPDGLLDLLAASDIVVLAAPLTPETESMIDEAAIAAMKHDAWLINVARGRLVDDNALIRALRDNRIGGAALDAFRDEPLPQSSPYWELPNVILTPHTAWSSARVLDRSIELFCDNLVRFSRGEELRNVVDPAAGY